MVWVVGAAGMHWRPLNTLITKELQASRPLNTLTLITKELQASSGMGGEGGVGGVGGVGGEGGVGGVGQRACIGGP